VKEIEYQVSLTKKEIDLVLNYLHNRTKPKTRLTYDLEIKLIRILGHQHDGIFARPDE